MIAAILRWLPLSLALHSAALAATLLLPRESVLLPLFVDLTLTEAITPPDVPSGARDSAATPRRQRAPDQRRAVSPSPFAPGIAPSPAAPAIASSAPAPEATSAPPTPAIPPAPPAALPPEPPRPMPAAPLATVPPPDSPAESAVALAQPPPAVSTDAHAGAASPGSTSPASGGGAMPSVSGAVDGSREAAPGPVGLAGGAGGRSAAGSGETLALGIAGDEDGAYAGYIALLRRRVQEALTYPSAARRRGMSGTVHLDISVEPTGKIADVFVVRSSSYDVLDTAALDAVRALRQIPFPPGVRPRAVRVRLPVVFELR